MTSRAPTATTHPRGVLPRVALSAQLVELDGAAPRAVRLLPAGTFKARDGRPAGLPGWTLDDAGARALLNAAQARQDRYLIDYDHQTLYASQNGGKAPAAGWFSQLDWRPGDGLYAIDVQWTAAAQAAIQAHEYRYISPVLSFDAKTGAVTALLMAALVNHPALDGLTDLAAAHFHHRREGHAPMNDALLKLLNLPDDADEAAVITAVGALAARLTAAETQLDTGREALSTAPDPAQFVPLAAMTALQAELAALSARVQADDLRKLIEPALADGRLLPAQQEWAEALGHKDLASLSAYLATAQPIAALKGTQTGGKAPDATPAAPPFKPAKGFDVDPAAAALHAQILNYQTLHGVDYLTAAKAVGA